jgi:predicted enzyme related to lactoylglutathione lyase
MEISIHYAFLPQTDPDATLAFYRDTLGFEVRQDVDYNGLRWLTVGPAGQPGTSVVLHPPAMDPGITDEERQTILQLIAKGSYGSALTLATDDLDGLFKRLVDSGADVLQEPMEQPYGVRDCAFREPTGNLLRINEVRGDEVR